ncbi:hypothetical protein ABGT16_05040 [Pseudomonas asiatica]|uniref:hypothetical protein n=1 Tax=Pseudomonas asiatica TaxID=2219225 RepID=UPI00345C90FD
MSYEGYAINKHSSCWILFDPQGEPIGSSKTKRECTRYLAKMFLEDEQSILAEAYQEKMREQGQQYSYGDALDALIHATTTDATHFIEVLRPELKKRFQAGEHPVFIVEIDEH